jgi:succinate dehydrogenase/fumarate reductase cytochrome b subunit
MITDTGTTLVHLIAGLFRAVAAVYGQGLFPVIAVWLLPAAVFLPFDFFFRSLRRRRGRDFPRILACSALLPAAAHGLWMTGRLGWLFRQYGAPPGWEAPVLRFWGGCAGAVMALYLIRQFYGMRRARPAMERKRPPGLLFPAVAALILLTAGCMHGVYGIRQFAPLLRGGVLRDSFGQLALLWTACYTAVILGIHVRVFRHCREETGYGRILRWEQALPRLVLPAVLILCAGVSVFALLLRSFGDVETVEAGRAVTAQSIAVSVHAILAVLFLGLSYHARAGLRLRLMLYHTGGVSAVQARLCDFPIAADMTVLTDRDALAEKLYALPETEVSVIGESRECRAVYGMRCGSGARPVSVIAGCHADEPAGPVTAALLPEILSRHFPELLEEYRFHIVPQINPDGAVKNRPWFEKEPDFRAYFQHAIREEPGDDIEFGFGETAESRPENRAAMDFLQHAAPFAAHFSLHGMPFAEGAWFLILREWRDQADALMDRLAECCRIRDMPLHDIDRKGEKGFTRIRKGFATTPTSAAMRIYFEERGDSETAALFRPSSMEFIQSLGGDPLCMVTEIPFFRIQRGETSLEDPVFLRFRRALEAIREADPENREERFSEFMEAWDPAPVPLAMQVRMQTAVIVHALRHISDGAAAAPAEEA